MANKNGLFHLLKIVAIALGIAATAGALMRTYIVGPVKDTAVEAKTQAEENEEDINKLDKRVFGVEKDVDNIDENVERLLGLFEVPTVREVPSGELTIDPPPDE